MLFKIRNGFEDGELRALYGIECECFAPEFRWAESVFRQEMAKARKSKLVWVAYIGSHIAGFLVAADEDGKINVETCDTRPAHRRKGVATRLMEACERAAKRRGYRHTRLEVYVENPAQILYFRLGYRAVGFRRGYYGLGKHAISMEKRL